MRTLATLLAALLATAAFAAPPARTVVLDNSSTCDVGTYPAATLLLPYFEVDFHASQAEALNTVFSVTNTTPIPQIVRVTLWTDYGFPGASFALFLTGYDTQAISLYDIFARGNFPWTSYYVTSGSASADNSSNPNFAEQTGCDRAGGTLQPSIRERIQRIFTTGEADDPNCRVGSVHTNAIGYATVDVVNSCASVSPLNPAYWNDLLLFDNVLTGDYERINPAPTTGNYAGGNPLVHIRAIPEGGKAGSKIDTPLPFTFYDRYTPAAARKIDRRQPLASTFAARFIQGGKTSFTTKLIIWREGLVGAGKTQCAYSVNEKLAVSHQGLVRFDEHENALVAESAAYFPASSAAATESSQFPPLASSGDVAGWMWMSLDNGAGRADDSPYSSQRPSQNWVVVQMSAEGRYAVDFDATQLANGCTLHPATEP